MRASEIKNKSINKSVLVRQSGLQDLIQSIILSERPHFNVLVLENAPTIFISNDIVEVLAEESARLGKAPIVFLHYSIKKKGKEIHASISSERLVKQFLEPLVYWKEVTRNIEIQPHEKDSRFKQSLRKFDFSISDSNHEYGRFEGMAAGFPQPFSEWEETSGAKIGIITDLSAVSQKEDKKTWDAWLQFFQRMNLVRNTIMKNIPGLLLFILPAPLEPEFANAAPDFWSIASNIVCLDCAQLDTGHKADDLSGFENLSRIEVASLAGFDFDYDVIQNQINKAKHEMEKTPDNPWIARSLVNWLTRQGDYYIKNGYLNQAVNVYEKALNITTDFSDRFEKDSEWLRKRYKSLEKLGEASFQLGDIEKALSAFNESVSIRRSLIQTDPERIEEWQNELAAGLLKLGDFYLDADMEFDSKLERAFDAFNESLVLRTALAEENRLFLPYQYDLAVSHSRVAIIYQEMGNIEQSIRHLTQALSILEYLTKENSNALNWQRAYNFCRKQLMLLRAKRDKL